MKPGLLESSRSRYELGEFVAEGGMGAIYLGRRFASEGDPGEEVIFKALLPEFGSEPHFVDLFLREARLTAGLDHPNIVRSLDLVTGQGTYFIVMEYVCGTDLRSAHRRAKRRGRTLAPEAALYVGLAMLDALAYAHSRKTPEGEPLGLVHRDISPSNILVGGDGAVKLSDFGIAKQATHRSVFYKVKGKVGYMSPEQARGEALDARSDLFSLAVCVHEALTGQRLFPAAPTATVSEIYARPAPRPSDVRPGLPHAIDAVMARALAYDRALRFPSAIELRDALLRAAAVSGMLWRKEQFAAHLVDVLGPEPRAWPRRDDLGHGAPSPNRALDVQIAAARIAMQQSSSMPSGLDGHGPGLDSALEEDDAPRPRPSTLVSGTSLVSVLEGDFASAVISLPSSAIITSGTPAELAFEEATVDLGGDSRRDSVRLALQRGTFHEEEATALLADRASTNDFGAADSASLSLGDEPTDVRDHAAAAHSISDEPTAIGNARGRSVAASPRPEPARDTGRAGPEEATAVVLAPQPSTPATAGHSSDASPTPARSEPRKAATPLENRLRELLPRPEDGLTGLLAWSAAVLMIGMLLGLGAGWILFGPGAP